MHHAKDALLQAIERLVALHKGTFDTGKLNWVILRLPAGSMTGQFNAIGHAVAERHVRYVLQKTQWQSAG